MRYNFLDSSTDNFLGGGGRASPTSSTARGSGTQDQAFVANAVSVFSSSMVNELRFQFARRTFDFSAVYNEPSLDISNFIIMELARLKVSGLVTLESGRRYNIFIGADSNADGNPNSDRPSFEGRNSYEGPGYAAVDLRVGREFAVSGRARLDVSVDFFDLFNRTNVKDVNTVWGGIDINTPPAPQFGFGTPRDVFNPFQTQIGVKLKF